MIDWKYPEKELPQFDTIKSAPLLLLTRFPGSSAISAKIGYAISDGEEIVFEFNGILNPHENKMLEEVVAWTYINLPSNGSEVVEEVLR